MLFKRQLIYCTITRCHTSTTRTKLHYNKFRSREDLPYCRYLFQQKKNRCVWCDGQMTRQEGKTQSRNQTKYVLLFMDVDKIYDIHSQSFIHSLHLLLFFFLRFFFSFQTTRSHREELLLNETFQNTYWIEYFVKWLPFTIHKQGKKENTSR